MAYKNKEDLIAYRKAHRKEANERSRLWRLANPGAAAAKAKEWRAANIDRARASSAKWRAENAEHVKKRNRDWRARTAYNQSPKRLAHNRKAELKRFGITPEQYTAMLEAQGRSCAICKSQSTGCRKAKHLYVDHCHASGRVRGLLCMHCNSMLGKARDSASLLRAGAEYLEVSFQ